MIGQVSLLGSLPTSQAAHGPLRMLSQSIDWEQYRPLLVEDKPRKSSAGRKSYDAVMMLKALLLQRVYVLTDKALVFLIADRRSFAEFVGMVDGVKIPDHATLSLFRKRLNQEHLLERIFTMLEADLRNKGLEVKTGYIQEMSFIKTVDFIPRDI